MANCYLKYFVAHAELEGNKRRVEQLETTQTTILYCSLLQVTGDGKEWTFVNQETSINLSFPSKGIPPISLSLEQLSCQLTDPLNKQVPCTITPTQPGLCTVMYTPTIRGRHQLSIKIKDTDVQGSPFRVNVLPEADSSVEQCTITEVKHPISVAVSKSRNIVVCHYDKYTYTISVFNKKGEKKPSISSSDRYFHVAITADDNHILAVSSRQIVKYTMEGRCVISVECTKRGFHGPSGIAVHPFGKVIVASSYIQVLNPDLTYSHSFGVHSHGVSGSHVACDSDGVVYVADKNCIRSFNIDGHCTSKCSYDFSNAIINGICIDSTNTLYASISLFDSGISQNRVSVHSSSGKFIKYLSFDGIEPVLPGQIAGIAVDNATGVLYACDQSSNCVIVY